MLMQKCCFGLFTLGPVLLIICAMHTNNYVQNAALQYIDKQKLEDLLSREYILTVAAKARRVQDCVDDVESTI